MDKTEEEEMENARLKILQAQLGADKSESESQDESQENFQPHIAYDEPAPIDEKLRVDQIQSQVGRVINTGPILGTSAVRPVGGADPVNYTDALEQWRYMSEQYRDRRLAREKQNGEKTPDQKVSGQAVSAEKSAPVFNETKFQAEYENDFVEISEPTADTENIERDKVLKRLSAANLEIGPELLVEPESDEIEPQNGKLVIADVMTRNVISVIDTMTIEQVASIFNKRKITSVPVVNYKTRDLIGIITMSDIIAHLFEDGVVMSLHTDTNSILPDTLTIMDKKVSALMHTKVFQVYADSSIKEACNAMQDNHIHQVLVTKNNRILGIFTAFDAVRILAKFDLKLE